MKKIIALFLSVLMMFSCLGIAASATSVVGRSSHPLGKPECTTQAPKPSRPECTTKPECPTKPDCTNKEECTTIINNNITIMPEEDPTTFFGFLYRIIKTVLPYLYKILSLLNIEISFGGNNASCNNCGSNNGCNCGNGGNGGINDDITIIIPTFPNYEEPTGGIGGDSDSDSDSVDSDSDSIDSILGGLFGDLFA